ncbi:MAG: hypothetical protein IKZ41_11755 [Clostridia bacterium]|nr:hypothetical protein [Clostridia bacterium]MBR5366907.1 hypothetical protein [Clostridia bacterium]
MKKTAALFLALLLLVVSCSNQTPDDTAPASDSPGIQDALSEETQAETEPDFLADVRYDGTTFSIMTSETTISSNYLIEGSGEMNGDNVNDAVFERNLAAEERLGVKFTYTQTKRNWDTVASQVKSLIQAGEDSYDLIIEDQRGMSTVSIAHCLADASQLSTVDFTENGWWADYMKNLSVDYKSIYLLVGDYFMDVLNHSHALLYNREMYRTQFGDPDDLYHEVDAGEWTYDRWIELVDASYADTNGNGKADKDDTYGMIVGGIGGSTFPFTYGSDVPFISRDEDGYPTLTMYCDRLLLLYEKIYGIFYSDGTRTNYAENGADLHAKFMENGSLFISGTQLGDFGTFRDMEAEIGLIPYPKLDENQTRYITVVHDTAEVGAIPTTARDPEMTGAVCQILCRLTHKSVLPTYYEMSLKIKYARDDFTSAMIDLIHDGITDEFCLVYGGAYANDIFTWAILEPLQKGDESGVASAYEKREKAALKMLGKLMDEYNGG